MSPRDLSPAIVRERLREIRRLLTDLERRAQVTAAELAQDRDVRHIVEHVLVQLVQQAVAVNSHVSASLLAEVVPDHAESFRMAARTGLLTTELADALVPSVGLRDVLVHEYLSIDLEKVAAAVPLAQELYGDYVQQVAAWLRDRG